MRRRDFLAAVAGSAAARPLAARAQQPTKLPTIGYLGASAPSFDTQRVGAFVQRLRELGWIESRTIAIEYRWSEGRTERYAEIAAEFVRLKVDVIVATGGAIPAAKQATSVIPIVFPVAGDPVGAGYVDTLARPGGNITGLSLQQTDVASKRVELLREAVPGLRRLAIMANVGNPNALRELGEVQAAASTLRLEATTSEIHGEPRILSLLSRRSRAARMGSMWWPSRSYLPTGLASTPWPWPAGCRRSTTLVSTSKWEG
jgi:putative ABC transport system substrate-binding protein